MKVYKISLFLIMIISKLFSYSPSLNIEEAQSNLEKRVENFNSWNKNNTIKVRFINEIAILQFKSKEQQIALTKTNNLFVYDACIQDFQDFVKERID